MEASCRSAPGCLRARAHPHQALPRAPNSPVLTNGGANEGGSITNVVETLLLDKLSHGRWKALVMSFDIVLQDEPTEGARWLICATGGKRTMGLL